MSEPPTSREVDRALQRRIRTGGRATQELFEFYLLERFLHRLSFSHYRDRFVLKDGRLLLTVPGARRPPPTCDADVPARGVAGDEDSLPAVVGAIAVIPADDGVSFDALSARVFVIGEHVTYPGLRRSCASGARALRR